MAMRWLPRPPTKKISALSLYRDSRHSCAVALLQSGTDVTVIRDYLGHTSVATTGRYITINLQMKREAMQAFWKKAGLNPVNAKPWKPKADLLAFLQSL
jgi:integrase/recombinase XerD